MQMQVMIDIPDWMARDLEARAKSRIGAEMVTFALRLYYMGLVAPPWRPEKWSHQTKVAMYGDTEWVDPFCTCPGD